MSKIKIKIRYYFSIIIYLLKLTPFQKKPDSGLVNIINFHYFVKGNNKIKDRSLEVSINFFKKQMSIFSKYFEILSISKNFKKIISIKKNNMNKNSILITVDDADYGFLKTIPTLKKHNIPIIMFAPIGFCLKKNNIIGLRAKCLHFAFFKKFNQNEKNNKKDLNLLFDKIMKLNKNKLKKYYQSLIKNENNFFLTKKFLSIKNLKYISKEKLITLSSHSMSHVPLSFLPDKWLKWEINMSQKFIKNCRGDTSLFAYPYGYKKSFNNNVKKILKKNGVKYAFTTLAKINTFGDDPLELGRTFVSNFANKNYLLGNASGSFSIYDKILCRI